MKNFILIYGLDKSLIRNEINKIKDRLGASEIIKYSLDKDNLEDIILDASLTSMFSDKKVILVENSYFFSSNKSNIDIKPLEEYLEHYNSDTIIIFVCPTEKIDTRKKLCKKISELGQVIETKEKDLTYVKNYIADYLKKYNYKLEDVNYFCSKVGTNIDNVKNELDKLMIYKDKNKIIGNSDIDKLIIPSLEDDIFSLTNAVIDNKIEESIFLLEEFLNKGYDELQIIALLANQFRFMFQVKRSNNKGYSETNISKELAANPYRVKITIKKCYYYTESDFLLYLKKLGELDENIKLGKIDKKIGLQLFLMNKDYKKDK